MPKEIVGMGIDGTNNLVLTWYDDRTVSGGSSRELSSKRAPYQYSLPDGKAPTDIVGIGVDGGNDFVFAFYADGTVSAGTSHDLGSRRKPQPFTLPKGKTPHDIVDVGIDGSNNLVVAWYRDGTVSAGSSHDLASRRPPEPYVLPQGKAPADIVGIGVDGFVSDDQEPTRQLGEVFGEVLEGKYVDAALRTAKAAQAYFGGRGSICFAWYKDGTVSAGSSTNLAEVRAPYSYQR